MKSIIHFFSTYSEYYIVALILMCGYSPYKIHPISLVIAGMLVLQIIFKNKIAGLIIAMIFAGVNSFMLLAVIFEFSKFPLGDSQGYILLSVGVSIIAINLLVCYLMFTKHLRAPERIATA